MELLRRKTEISHFFRSVGSVVRHGVLLLLALVVSGPLLWMMLSSFKGIEELWAYPPTFFPHQPTVSGFETIFRLMPFARYFFNSAVISVSATALVILTSSLAGYVFAKIGFRGRNILFIVVLGSMMIPGQVTVIQNFVTLRFLGWINTYSGLIIPQGISVFGIFLMRQFMHSIPDDYMDAARIDGLSESRIFSSIVLPLNTTAIATVAIFGFRGTWDNLLWPLIMTSGDKMRTLPVGIAGLATVHSPEMQLLLPAATISVVPTLIVFAIFQRQFVEGAAASGLKM